MTVFLLLKECPEEIQTSVLQIRTPLNRKLFSGFQRIYVSGTRLVGLRIKWPNGWDYGVKEILVLKIFSNIVFNMTINLNSNLFTLN